MRDVGELGVELELGVGRNCPAGVVLPGVDIVERNAVEPIGLHLVHAGRHLVQDEGLPVLELAGVGVDPMTPGLMFSHFSFLKPDSVFPYRHPLHGELLLNESNCAASCRKLSYVPASMYPIAMSPFAWICETASVFCVN